MKESKFIEQNKKKWQEFETDLLYGRNKSSKLSRLFIQVTDDLSFVRTFYPHRSVKIYLNGMAQYLFNDLYRNQATNFKGFVKFWKVDLPLLIHDSRKEFRISFIIFLLAFAIGIISSIYDKDFARFILGDQYVKMTTENIHNNDPMAVYKKAHEVDMFFGITVNNLMVALSTFLLGVFLSIGAVFRLLYNGIMVGVFQYFFIERGLFAESFLTIWQHGTLEISSIIIAGAAGITLGKGLVFPGSYARMESFKISALRGLKIFLGITPVIIMAAFIEGFLTRHTELPPPVRIIVIAISLMFVLFYFVWYPWFLSKRYPHMSYTKERSGYTNGWKLDFSRILSAEEILGYTFRFVTGNFLWVVLIVAIISGFHAVGVVLKDVWDANYLLDYLNHSLLSFFYSENASFHFLLGLVSLSFLQCTICLKNRRLLQALGPKVKLVALLKLIISSLIASFAVLIPFGLGFFWGVVSLVFLSPFVFLALFHAFATQSFVFTSLPGAFKVMNKSWGKLYWNSIKIFVFITILFILFNTPFVWQYIENIYQNFNFSPAAKYIVDLFVFTFIVVLLLSIFFIFQMTTSVYSYFAFRETVFAENLMDRIQKFGERRVMFGFEKEL
ncbi:MAG TPA: stage II sporulation protein M [Bacteroidales bacterium]|nr:stage II sporulation protein M [Bacteroidales bacterium]